MPTSTDLPPRLPPPGLSLHPSGQLISPEVRELTNQLFHSIDNTILPWFKAHLQSSYSPIPNPKFHLKELAEFVRDNRIRVFPSATVYQHFEVCISIRKKLLGCYVEAVSVFGEEILRSEIGKQEQEVEKLEEALRILKEAEEWRLEPFGYNAFPTDWLIGTRDRKVE